MAEHTGQVPREVAELLPDEMEERLRQAWVEVVPEFTGEIHPVADLFPMLTEEELDELADDIAERGLLQPVVLDQEGRLLDGRNRLAACERAGVEPRFTVYRGDDPDGFALSVNLTRRHLTKGQQAMVAARARFVANHPIRGVAAQHGVSHSRIAYATTVLDHAPDLADSVLTGATPLDAAYKVARDRKMAADQTEAKLAELREKAPDLADLVVEERMSLSDALGAWRQRQEDRDSAARRAAARLEQLVTGWEQLKTLPNDPEREVILARLSQEDRTAVEDIERLYMKGSKR